MGCSLKGSTVSIIAKWDHFHINIILLQRTFFKSGETSVLCSGNSMNVLPYAHPQLFKLFKHLIYI